MIETPVGVANAYEIANVPGIDVVFIGNGDLQRFSGLLMGDPLYEKMVSDIRDGVIRAGKIFGCANATYRHPSVCHDGAVDVSEDATFFQNGPSHDGWEPDFDKTAEDLKQCKCSSSLSGCSPESLKAAAQTRPTRPTRRRRRMPKSETGRCAAAVSPCCADASELLTCLA